MLMAPLCNLTLSAASMQQQHFRISKNFLLMKLLDFVDAPWQSKKMLASTRKNSPSYEPPFSRIFPCFFRYFPMIFLHVRGDFPLRSHSQRFSPAHPPRASRHRGARRWHSRSVVWHGCSAKTIDTGLGVSSCWGFHKGGFPKMGVPPISGWFYHGKSHLEMDDFGVPLFQETFK